MAGRMPMDRKMSGNIERMSKGGNISDKMVQIKRDKSPRERRRIGRLRKL